MELKFGFQPVADTPSYVKFLLYGPAGTGKTYFSASAPNPWWFDTENSTETLRHHEEYRQIPVKKGDDILNIMRDVEKLVKEEFCETVVIDSITTALDKFTRAYVKKESLRSGKRDQFTLYEADYKYATQVFTELFGFLSDAPINVVLIGHERITRDPESGRATGIYPDVTPRLQQAVTRLVNVVGYLNLKPSTLKETKRELHLVRTPIIEAKNRLGITESPLENPVWKEIF